MFGENKNLKDPRKDSIKDTSSLSAPYQTVACPPDGQGFSSGSYKKTNKLITALYMVTDIIDENEPLKNKLRTLGIEILSDISTMSKIPFDIFKIDQIMSFLNIASAVNIISEMNCSILKKEFLELDRSIKGSFDKIRTLNKEISLSEFFGDSPLPEYPLGRDGIFPSHEGLSLGLGAKLRSGVREGLSTPVSGHPRLPIGGQASRGEVNSKGHYSIGHRYSTRVGVQKGSTLMKALSDKIGAEARSQGLSFSHTQGFDILKKQRRVEILNIIKTIGGNVTIKDIKDRIQKIQVRDSPLVSYGEKTLQRELVSMVKDSVLNKTGQKRWSRYFLK